mgnify:CR=1 FL=1
MFRTKRRSRDDQKRIVDPSPRIWPCPSASSAWTGRSSAPGLVALVEKVVGEAVELDGAMPSCSISDSAPVASLDPAYALDAMAVLRAEPHAAAAWWGACTTSGLAARFADRVVVLANGGTWPTGRPTRPFGRRSSTPLTASGFPPSSPPERRNPAGGPPPPPGHAPRYRRRLPHRHPRRSDATGSVVTAALRHRLGAKRHRRNNFHGPRYGGDTYTAYSNSRRRAALRSPASSAPVHPWVICSAAP